MFVIFSIDSINNAKIGSRVMLYLHVAMFLRFLGLDFKIKSLHVGEQLVKMQLWDTSGQERFR